MTSHALVARLFDGKQLVRMHPFGDNYAPKEFVSAPQLVPRLMGLDPESDDRPLPIEKWAMEGYANQQIWTYEMWMIDCGPQDPPSGSRTQTGGVRVQLVDYRRVS